MEESIRKQKELRKLQKLYDKKVNKHPHHPQINEKSKKLLKNYSPIHLRYNFEMKKKKKTLSKIWNKVNEEKVKKEKMEFDGGFNPNISPS